ncbi:hypothetical protein HX871_26395 [Pseudomonas reactans]|uniref:Uncharacterized protein n=1 Tax=Pseudomonas reactans TaxID=117680 RepID=A0ABX2R1L7_9PSED|nr:hypothetical protein [Pseudomonas reactans]NWA42538.1 hypothetical protein [Pseudomonas reactans]NWC87192.1 hypothetical protein [Pseudomonas reactans]NWD30402.1 hypothetical protein [Pseudomonas reactans]NWD97964.1 hypothetical protein [Pseudomonas reactans]NWF16403.1 hypothetical protein [Pseudomonas reactans]
MNTSMQVYLDSSDFSNLSRAQGKDGHAMSQIKSKLLHWVNSGKIEIRYSMAHIMEAVPVDIASAEFGQLRLSCIKQLCGTKVFMDPISLIINELSGTVTSGVLNDRGHWLPNLAELWKDDTSNDQSTEPPKNRQQRRADKAKTKKALATDNTLVRDITREFPIKQSKTLEMLSAQDFTSALAIAMQDSVNDLDFLSNWYVKNWNTSTQFSTSLRTAGKGLNHLLTESSAELKTLHDELVATGASASEVNKRLTALAKQLADKAPQDFIDALSEGHIPANSLVTASPEGSPSMYVASKFIAQMFLSSVVSTKNTRKARDSDLGDLIHTLYIPYVDFFRADLATANALKNAQIKCKAKVVTSLEDLISNIESALDARSAAVPAHPLP